MALSCASIFACSFSASPQWRIEGVVTSPGGMFL
jgi:hypothetical protein